MNVLEIFGIIFIVQLAIISTIFILSIVFSIIKYNSDKIKNKYVSQLTEKIKTGNFDISATDNGKDKENVKILEDRIKQMEQMQDIHKNLNDNSIPKEAFEKALEEAKMEIEEKE